MLTSDVPQYRPPTIDEFAQFYVSYGGGLAAPKTPTALRRRIIADAVFRRSVAIRCIVVTELYQAAGVDGVRDAVVAALAAHELTLDRGDHNFVGVCVLALLEWYGYEKLLDERGRPVSARALSPFSRGQVYHRRPGTPCILDDLDVSAQGAPVVMSSHPDTQILTAPASVPAAAPM